MMNNRLKSTGFAALSFSISAGILALALVPAMATAASPATELEELTVNADRDVRTRRVATADLDLANASDLKRLDSRIRRAIGEVCREPGFGRVTFESVRCGSDARRSADQQVAALLRSGTALAANATSADISLAAR